MGFSSTEAKKLAKLTCIGRVQSVGECKVSNSGKYLTIPIEIEGYGASRSIRVWFTFQPEWLTNGFKTESFREYGDEGKKMEKVFASNIQQDGAISLLQGLTGGTKEGLEKLAAVIQALPINEEVGGPTGSDVADALREYLVDEENGALVGYVLSQQRNFVGVDPDTNKGIYKNTPYYEVNTYFVPDEKGRKRQVAAAARAAKGTHYVQFSEDDCPFN